MSPCPPTALLLLLLPVLLLLPLHQTAFCCRRRRCRKGGRQAANAAITRVPIILAAAICSTFRPLLLPYLLLLLSLQTLLGTFLRPPHCHTAPCAASPEERLGLQTHTAEQKRAGDASCQLMRACRPSGQGAQQEGEPAPESARQCVQQTLASAGDPPLHTRASHHLCHLGEGAVAVLGGRHVNEVAVRDVRLKGRHRRGLPAGAHKPARRGKSMKTLTRQFATSQNNSWKSIMLYPTHIARTWAERRPSTAAAPRPPPSPSPSPRRRPHRTPAAPAAACPARLRQRRQCCRRHRGQIQDGQERRQV